MSDVAAAVVAETAEEVATPTRVYTAQDRCDRCGAQALASATWPDGRMSELLFCGHHSREFREGLEKSGATVLDIVPVVA